ncbi:hypothetical protein KIN20_032070 [Parelaphostrongylus tenuis]|nr:hypothetical protein KIN20_032070 [Parelaphostrongylus tenuis]
MNDLSSEKLRISQGLRMVPDFGTAITNSFVNLSKDKVIKGRYGSIIRDYLEAYKKEQISRSNFTKTCEANEKPSHAWCEFPLKVFDTGGCTAVNNYGFDNGEPCFLFEFKLHSNWTPKLGGNETVLPLECGVYDQVTMSKGIKITYISASGVSSQYGGFPLNKVPSRTILDDKGRDVCDENGETLYDQPALVLVKLRLGKSVYTSVRCFIGGDTSETSVLNLSAMRGNRDISFDIFYPYAK